MKIANSEENVGFFSLLSRLRSKAEKDVVKKLHLFGDSHLIIYTKVIGVLTYYRIGATMHRVGRDGLASLTEGLFANGIENVPDGEAIGFVFGEVDVRVHVGRQHTTLRRDSGEILDTLVEAFGKTVAQVRAIRPHSPIYIFSPVPPAGMKYPGFDPQYPRNGSDYQRAVWSSGLCERLEKMVATNGYRYVDQHSPFRNEYGLLDESVSDDGVHVRQSLVDRVVIPNFEPFKVER